MKMQPVTLMMLVALVQHLVEMPSENDSQMMCVALVPQSTEMAMKRETLMKRLALVQ